MSRGESWQVGKHKVLRCGICTNNLELGGCGLAGGANEDRGEETGVSNYVMPHWGQS